MEKFSLILIYNGEEKLLKKNLYEISKQNIEINELIVVDSSNKSQKTKQIISNFFDDENHKYINSPKALPGKARNIGIKNAENDIIVFLDIKTIPCKNWLIENLKIFLNNNFDYLLGKTKYIPNSFSKKIISSAIYGNVIHDTIPGSFFRKKIFEIVGLFNESVRAGEDIDFKNRLLENDFKFDNTVNYLVYEEIESNIFNLCKKYVVYSYHNAYLDCLTNNKLIYMFIFSFILFISTFSKTIITFFSTYSNVKLFITILITLVILPNIFNLYFKYKRKNFFNVFLNFFTLVIIILFIYNWNYFNYILNFNLYIPHITKISILLIILTSIFIRGVMIPYKLKVDKKFIQKYFFLIGINGTMLDIAKIPGYIFGYIINPFFSYELNIFSKYDEINHINKKKNLLFLCPFPYDVQAGQRLKFEQFYPYIKEDYNIFTSSFIDYRSWEIIYKKGYYFKKIKSLITGYFKRFLLIYYLNKFDQIYVFMWVTPYLSNFLEKVYRKKSKKIIYDIEDNILIIKKNKVNPINHFFKSQKKISYLIKKSDKIIASSPDLSDTCNKISKTEKSVFISPAINLNRYVTKKNYIISKKITLGWTGTFTSKEYLDLLVNLLKDLNRQIDFRLIVISDFDYDIEDLEVVSIKWTKKNEIRDLSLIDIGLYPLKKDAWVSGKSGLKALQYMAMGIPTIATNYGNNKNIITNMVNGILVDNIVDWKEAIIKLSNDYDLRKKIGVNGRLLIENKYSIQEIYKKYEQILNS